MNIIAGQLDFRTITTCLKEYLNDNGITRVITVGENLLTCADLTISLNGYSKEIQNSSWATIEIFDDGKYKLVIVVRRRDRYSNEINYGSVYDPDSFPKILESIKKRYEN